MGEIFKLSVKDIELLDIYESVAEGMYGQPQAEYSERINHGMTSANLPLAYVQKSIRPFIPES